MGVAPPALTPEQAFQVDRAATERFGIPSILLMENAGRACAEQALALGNDVGILVGGGNNGGDGLVVGRTLFNRGIPVRLYTPFDLALKGDAATNLKMAEAAGLRVEKRMPERHAVLVDALFGIGLSRDLEGAGLDAVRALNASGAKILAVDVPSGLDALTGRGRGDAVRADVTVTLGFPKVGFSTPSAKEYTGTVVVAEIGYPPQLIADIVGEKS